MSGLTCYLNGDYMPHGDAKVPVDDRGFLFADGVYEVIKSYGGYIFTEKEHCDRLRRGLSELRFSGCDGVVEEVMAAGKELLKRNKLETSDATIYIQITRGCAPRAHAFPNPPVKPTVYVIAKPFKMPPAEQLDNGVGAVTHPDQRWARCDIKSISLLPNVLANQKAKEAGCYECLLIRDGNIVEASHSNVFAVLDGALYTHPLDNILPGITRGVIVRRAGELSRGRLPPSCRLISDTRGAPLIHGVFLAAWCCCCYLQES